MIELDEAGGVAVVRLAHGKVNALDLELLERITATFTELDAGPAAAIVFTGAGRAFSAGVDLWRVIDGGAGYVHAFLPALEAAFLAVFSTGKPVVAALNGHAIAGGAILAAACDHRVMADGAGTIGVTELRVGVPFPASALEILGHAYGEPQARRQVLAADTLGPAAALAAGRVDELAPPDGLLDAAVAVARRLAARTRPDTFRLTKAQLQATVRRRLAARSRDLDPQVSHLWVQAVEDGRLREYMASVRA
ncbi:enoyl-CoA hydratase [Actinoplanes octamycinicus]|uniref:Enoyl-CoA hydratase n=1 Tax=Actinoplanes octamycinicus TaxID=135948 RepID=A0A7W7H0D2_9ACTN|nr:enoyl-CoA hydratase/isomerase family protein [Actinoplanes octamycinicus]MBB4741650.1 enoyl-CoA hydratase [Actinoplanes octamycinicus]GIE57203.1 enoyl-CoA hydratase [Actinoplanes octamycinicus]